MNIIIAAETLGERALTALKDSLLGMVVIFAALSILWAAIEILHACVAAGSKKKANQPPEAAEDAPAPAVPEALPDESEDEAAVVAAITAAISVMLEEPVSSFKVVSFKRVDSHAHWNRK